jgi:hypothetical protein
MMRVNPEAETRIIYSARAGIRTRVKGVTVPHTGPDFTMHLMHFYTTRALQILSLAKPIKTFCFILYIGLFHLNYQV